VPEVLIEAAGLGALSFLAVRRLEFLLFATDGTWLNPELLICPDCKRQSSAGGGRRCDCGGEFEPIRHWQWLPDLASSNQPIDPT
jgi:hypothetical protein